MYTLALGGGEWNADVIKLPIPPVLKPGSRVVAGPVRNQVSILYCSAHSGSDSALCKVLWQGPSISKSAFPMLIQVVAFSNLHALGTNSATDSELLGQGPAPSPCCPERLGVATRASACFDWWRRRILLQSSPHETRPQAPVLCSIVISSPQCDTGLWRRVVGATEQPVNPLIRSGYPRQSETSVLRAGHWNPEELPRLYGSRSND